MRVLYFAHAAELTGCREEVWEVTAPTSMADFWAEATRRHPGLLGLADTARIACGMEYLGAEGQIDPEKEVAVIPPVSGG